MSIFSFMKSKAPKQSPSLSASTSSENPTAPHSSASLKEFDLNIEKILESWEVYHAVREIIANALDEQLLTNTREIEIYQDADNWWHIIDFGRGLNYHHLTQNENEEKLNNDKLIGRFGVGLKDALATLYRHGILVKIKSKYGTITLKTSSKVGFDDIITLHAEIVPPDDVNMVGTDFALYGCTLEDIEKAKSLFLKFTNDAILESTRYGDVLDSNAYVSNIYINGVKVAEEPNFLFSYNITSLNAQIKKSLNRERTNVGRTAYTGRIKDILKDCSSEVVIKRLINDLQSFGSGNRHDELAWNDVAMYASMKMSSIQKSTTFVTATDLQRNPSLIDEMRQNGYTPVVVPDNLISKMDEYNRNAPDENALPTTNQYVKDSQKRFTPTIVNIDSLSPTERAVHNYTSRILKLLGKNVSCIKEIQIVDKIYESEIFIDTVGLWIPSERKILIKRSQLNSLTDYAGTLLHECLHALSGAPDVSRDFERALTHAIGIIASQCL